MITHERARIAVALAAASMGTVAAALAVSACSGTPDTSLDTEVAAPDYNQFIGKGIDPTKQASPSFLLEQRCGTLDCHGQVGRALRIYGQDGLRFVTDGGTAPGLGGTTDIEHTANYQSVIGLQPEIMTLVVTGSNPPEALMLIRKPLQLERHKGGAVFVSGDDAYNCLTSWLAGTTDFNACYNGTTH